MLTFSPRFYIRYLARRKENANHEIGRRISHGRNIRHVQSRKVKRHSVMLESRFEQPICIAEVRFT